MSDERLRPVECTPWCREGNGHTDELIPVDQACMSEKYIIELTTEPLGIRFDGTTGPQTVSVYLLRERNARITTLELSINDEPEVSLTTEESLALRAILTDLVLIARPCPGR
jgi:hypothetical protein